MCKRVFLFVMDSFGTGEMPDAEEYGDVGSNTLRSVCSSPEFDTPFLTQLGLFNIDGAEGRAPAANPTACFARLAESSVGKETVIGHWEMAGCISQKPMPMFPQGFPEDILDELRAYTGRDIVCNKPYSGTEVIRDYGEEQMKTGALIVYTSADSVFQIAANEALIPPEELYDMCRYSRKIFDRHGIKIGRIIARPFVGTCADNFKRTPNRHDFSLRPPKKTLLDFLMKAELDVVAIGKIWDIFCGCGITTSERITDNSDGMEKAKRWAQKDFHGLCFVNLVDFDMLYGHRNNVPGYAHAVSVFDRELKGLSKLLREDDIVIVTADHGCDPATESTDHSREYVPMLVYGNNLKEGVNLGTRSAFSDIGATIAEYLDVPADIDGTSFLPQIL